jgi:AcrR family transcriptional regulator
MDEKKKNILQAAIDVFSRYGVRRATMGDIASAAGISRQTLYGSYSSKEDVFTAALQYAIDMTLLAIEAEWQTQTAISEKLDTYFQLAVIDYFERTSQMPDAEDLHTGFNEAGKAALEKANERKRIALEGIFAPFADRLAARGTSPSDLADLVQSSAANFKLVARNRKHLARLVKTLKQAVLTLIVEN